MTDKKETLVILSPGFPASEEDTTCLPFHQVFVRALQRNFPAFNIIIIAFQYPPVATEYKWNNNTVISLNGKKKGKINRLLLWIKAWRVLKKIKKHNHVKGLLSFWLNECALVGKYFGKRHHIKHYCWMIGQDAKKGNPYVKLVRPRGNQIIAISDFLASQFYENYQVKPFRVITNGIDVGLFEKEAKERRIDILAAGSLIPLKQYNVFIETVKLVHDELPQLKAMLCGAGPEEQNLKMLAKMYGLEKNVHLAGERKHKEILALMQQCRVFLHTSNYEGFSTVCLEALYAGAHVISFFSAMEKDITHWHIVQTKEEMASKALELLLDPFTQYTPVLPYNIDYIATSVMKLF